MEKPISVSELTYYIKEKLENTFRGVYLQGEISNFKLQTSGHMYFTLKDENAQISCVMFRGEASRIKSLPKEGDKVTVKGEISVYAPQGKYQLVIRELNFAGVGDLLLKYQKLKEKLQGLGWFDNSRKKELPKFPKTIGVVTSPTGAVIRDIIHVLERRFGNFHLVLNPVKVQGEGAAQEIARAIYEFNQYKLADVLIVGRGGGSFEDLFCFSEEIVAKAIFESDIPIISAVGHETDYSIADFVADVRAPTPSAAAEIALGEKAHVLDFLKKTRHTLQRFLHLKINTLHQRLDDFVNQLDRAILGELRGRKIILESLKKRFNALNPLVIINHQKQHLQRLVNHLRSLDPKNLLKKGYSILFDEKSGSVITSAKDLSIGTNVIARLSDGGAKLLVEEKL